MLIFLLLVAASGVTSQDQKPAVRLKCGPNEKCYPKGSCPPRNCDIPYTTYKCLPEPRGPVCDCIDGYLRGPDKKCIRKEKCPPPRPKCGPNEKYFPEVPCPPRNCPDDKMYICDGRPEPRGPGCDCIDGYLRGPDKKCIRKEKCPPPRPKCGPNEKYYPKGSCPPRNCDIPYTTYSCLQEPRGPVCDCIDGYLRGPDKKCIRQEKCPPPRPKCGPNEKYFLEVPCPPRNCPDDKVYICDGRPEPRGPGCRCIDGYLRGPDGKCIRKEKCPPPRPKCGLNEKYFHNVPCPPRDCNIPYTTYLCLPEHRGPGCDCIDGYLRGPDKKCIRTEKCPPPPFNRKCPENERWADCGHQCSNAFCPIDDSRAVLLCKPPRDCKPGCVCKVGYRRRDINNAKSKCILAEKCPKKECTREHEKWNPCPRCLDDSCAAAHKPPTTCNELIKNCQPQCTCKKNHFRNSHGKCVPKEQCPK